MSLDEVGTARTLREHRVDDLARGAGDVARPIPKAGSEAMYGESATRSSRCRSKLPGSFNKIDHMGCRVNRQRMLGEARPWRNVGRHLTCKVELPIRCFCKQRDHQVFQCNYTNAKLHQLGVCQLRNFPL